MSVKQKGHQELSFDCAIILVHQKNLDISALLIKVQIFSDK